jgi:O-methyltransferase
MALELLKQRVQSLLNRFGYEIHRPTSGLGPEALAIFEKVRPFTATGPGRVLGLIDAVTYVVNNRIPGAFVECGVWRGGSVMAAAHTLQSLGDTSRELYLFDTFEGMTAPSDKDNSHDGRPASQLLAEAPAYRCIADLTEVRRNVLSTGYPPERIHFIQGKVEDTTPGQAPAEIALLRLDTDWYESTRHELLHLYSRLVPNGVLIIDDYGEWQGARQAVDEFFSAQPLKPFFTRLDYTGRLLIKPDV